MRIEKIKEFVCLGNYEKSIHTQRKTASRNIQLSGLETDINSAEILEHYPDDPRGESCLILCYSKNQPIHIVVGYASPKKLRIITSYVPTLPKWFNERIRAEDLGSS